MKDHANRDWCTKPNSEAWREAWRKTWRAENPLASPRVPISNMYARQSIVFAGRSIGLAEWVGK